MSLKEQLGINKPPACQWYNVFSWPARAKFTAYGLALGIVSHVSFNYYRRRPYYAGLPTSLAYLITIPLIGYGIGTYRDYHMRVRDAVVEHYMELHPEDFEQLKGSERKWKDVFLPWIPIRYYEQPIKWAPKNKFTILNRPKACPD
ncbi:unnamed protein product [Soboliphyme baturini]|uniref:NADH dehydrogenase [ubiquinone] 1 subunit C2 n=1 Tax=Soboliphyme baturini TaxID=241478 RepID=A0A183II26_9BILA|nr:unnamed protein product [Soboliphyme baturini]